MHEIKGLVEHGMSVRTMRVLWREGFKTVEDLLGTNEHEDTIAQGPEPWYYEYVIKASGKHGKTHTVYVIGPGHESWLEYRYRPAWQDVRNIGVVAVTEIKKALEEWKGDLISQRKSPCGQS